jgi:hypothetical protein
VGGHGNISLEKVFARVCGDDKALWDWDANSVDEYEDKM